MLLLSEFSEFSHEDKQDMIASAAKAAGAGAFLEIKKPRGSKRDNSGGSYDSRN